MSDDNYIKEQAIKHDLADHPTLRAFERVGAALTSVADGNLLDRGLGFGSCDYWIKIAGKEWYITMRPSNAKIDKEQHDE